MSYPPPQNARTYEYYGTENTDGIEPRNTRFSERPAQQKADAAGWLVVQSNAPNGGSGDGLDTTSGPTRASGLFDLGTANAELVIQKASARRGLVILPTGACPHPCGRWRTRSLKVARRLRIRQRRPRGHARFCNARQIYLLEPALGVDVTRWRRASQLRGPKKGAGGSWWGTACCIRPKTDAI
jgi:hypothetical protein